MNIMPQIGTITYDSHIGSNGTNELMGFRYIPLQEGAGYGLQQITTIGQSNRRQVMELTELNSLCSNCKCKGRCYKFGKRLICRRCDNESVRYCYGCKKEKNITNFFDYKEKIIKKICYDCISEHKLWKQMLNYYLNPLFVTSECIICYENKTCCQLKCCKKNICKNCLSKQYENNKENFKCANCRFEFYIKENI